MTARDDNHTTVGGKVSLADVRAALTDTNPNETNAGKVRALLGDRGSLATIQKYLGILRDERAAAAAPPSADYQAPAVPPEAAEAMWVAAWSAAQVQALRRTETLSTERDAALLKLETLGQDVTGLTATVDEQAAELERAAVTVANVQAAHLADVERFGVEQAAAAAAASSHAAALTEDLEHAGRELAKVQAASAHAAELADARQDGMRGELARLTDQVGELKAALYKRAEPKQIPAMSE